MEKQTLIESASTLFEQKKYSEIIDLLPDEVLKIHQDATLFALRARAFYGTQPLLAKKDADKAIELDSKLWIGYFVRGNLLLDQLKYTQAIIEFTKAIVLNDACAPAYNNRALAWFYENDYDKSIDDFKAALNCRPNDKDTILNLALVYEQAGRYKDAIEQFQAVIVLNHMVDDSETKINELKERIAVELEENIENGLEKIKSIVSVIRQNVLASEVKQVVHYSKLFVADIISSKRDSHIHYSNVIYMNDPQEGKTFIEYLKDPELKRWFEKASYKNESTIFLGSFLPVHIDDQNGSAEDQLLMWRTYGKDENGVDAAGCNFVINSSFFEVDMSATTKRKIPKTFKKIKEQIEKGTKYTDNNRNSLLFVQYIRDNKILEDKSGLMKNLIEYLIDEVKMLIQKNEREVTKESAKSYTNSRIYDALQEMCHLFKAADYSFEREVRIIKAESRNSKNIEYYKAENGAEPRAPKHFYIKSYKPILPHLSKIYLGPKVKNPLHWGLHFDYSLRLEDRELTELEDLEDKLVRNIVLGTEELARHILLKNIYPGGRVGVLSPIIPNNIEIIPSKCQFV